MTLYRQSKNVIDRLKRRGEPLTLQDIAELGRVTRAGASQIASRLIAAGRLERLPFRGSYAFPGWQERPWAEFMVFRAWLRLNPGLGWIDASEATWLRGNRWLQSRPRDMRWRVRVISHHSERVLSQYYQVKRAKHLASAGTITIKGTDVLLGLPEK